MLLQDTVGGAYQGFLPHLFNCQSECSNSESHQSGSRMDGAAHRVRTRHFHVDPHLREEVNNFAEIKKRETLPDEASWKETIKQQLEEEISQRVREALDTPPLERIERNRDAGHRRYIDKLDELNAHIQLDLTEKEKEYVRSKRWKAIQAKRRMRRLMSQSQIDFGPTGNMSGNRFQVEFLFNDELNKSDQDQYPGVFGLDTATEGVRSYQHYARIANKALKNFSSLSEAEKHQFFYAFTKQGFKEAMRTGRLPDGSLLTNLGNGKFRDKYGIIRDCHGPFWPADYGPMCATPNHKRFIDVLTELLVERDKETSTRTVDNQQTQYNPKFRGVLIVYDSERSGKDYEPPAPTEGNSPSLQFESRFESGNLRQARRVGQFEYDLVLKTDLYTNRHTQWYYFRVKNPLPGITYRFRILNLLKRDSLYNHGMRPLVYSEKDAETRRIGWIRTGHHIRNVTNLHCPLLSREMNYYQLEWQMEFPHGADTYYMAHCYPYTYTDLKDDLDLILSDKQRSKVADRQVLCETRAGNSCFLLTITNFESEQSEGKMGVVVTARVHPGESNSSWMMKGLLDFLTSSDKCAKELRDRFVFKIVPMLNPDGVIVGNYRCSLAARDLNRNYRHPRCESFPTIYYTKLMMEEFAKLHNIVIYCDLHGHSRKSNVFMYGCTSQAAEGVNPAEHFLNERLFPWLMSQQAPDKFNFKGCKFQIKRCKEATGRVVMYKQMNINNSFTMEATFSGTTLNSTGKRHFNTLDFQEMGKVFGRVVLEYQQTLENKAKQSEVVLDLTREVAHQILEARGLVADMVEEVNAQVQDKNTESTNKEPENLSPRQQFNAAIVTSANNKPDEESQTKPQQRAKKNNAKIPDRPKDKEKSRGRDVSKVDVLQLLDSMSSKTIDGCINILEQLNFGGSVVESDSSDSDSESEPEMKYEPRSHRKKKKKSKRARNQEKEIKEKNCERPKCVSALPAIHTPDMESNKKKKPVLQPGPPSHSHPQKRAKPQHPLPGDTVSSLNDSCLSSVYSKSAGPTFSVTKKILKNQPGFVNKYEGRSNGGIPCFSEERSLERAAKRMQEMKKRMEAEERREALYYNLEDSEYMRMMNSHPNIPMPRSQTTLDLKSHMQQTFGGGLHIRTGYIHAEPGNQNELGPTVHQANVPYTGHHERAENSMSEYESDDLEEVAQRPAVTALHSPYQNVSTSHHQLEPLTNAIRPVGSEKRPVANSVTTPSSRGQTVSAPASKPQNNPPPGCGTLRLTIGPANLSGPVRPPSNLAISGSQRQAVSADAAKTLTPRLKSTVPSLFQPAVQDSQETNHRLFSPRSRAPSRDCTDVLLHQLRGTHPLIQANRVASKALLRETRAGVRHSTCE